MPLAIDSQIGGIIDDGTYEGVVGVKPKLTDLVRVPFTPQMIEQQLDANGSSINFIGDMAQTNPDLTGSVLSIKVAAASAANTNFAWIRFRVQGRVVGLYYTPMKFQPSQADFGAFVDYAAYQLPGTVLEPDTLQPINSSLYAWNYGKILADNLPFGDHVVDLYFPNNYNPITNTSSVVQWELYGFIAERAGGYRERPPLLTYSKPVTLSTAATYLAAQAEFVNGPHGIKQIFFYNSSGGAVTVNVQVGTGASSTVIWSKSVAAGDTQVLDFGGLMGFFNNIGNVAYEITMYASVSSAIVATTIGGL